MLGNLSGSNLSRISLAFLYVSVSITSSSWNTQKQTINKQDYCAEKKYILLIISAQYFNNGSFIPIPVNFISFQKFKRHFQHLCQLSAFIIYNSGHSRDWHQQSNQSKVRLRKEGHVKIWATWAFFSLKKIREGPAWKWSKARHFILYNHQILNFCQAVFGISLFCGFVLSVLPCFVCNYNCIGGRLSWNN